MLEYMHTVNIRERNIYLERKREKGKRERDDDDYYDDTLLLKINGRLVYKSVPDDKYYI